MAAKQKPAEPVPTAQLIDALYTLRAERDGLSEEIAAIELQVIERGPGKHTGEGEGHEVTVVAAVPGRPGKVFYTLDDKDPDKLKAMEAKARELAGEEFGNLFDRHVSYTPCEGFEAVAPKLLTPAKARDLLALCAREGKAYAGARAYLKYA